MEHKLKIWPQEYEAILRGLKNWEFRKNDRDFHRDDILILECYDPHSGYINVPSLRKKVVYLINGGKYGIPEDYCIMSLETRPLGRMGERGKLVDLIDRCQFEYYDGKILHSFSQRMADRILAFLESDGGRA